VVSAIVSTSVACGGSSTREELPDPGESETGEVGSGPHGGALFDLLGLGASGMRLVSRDAPAFASGNASATDRPEHSNDGLPNDVTWVPDRLPAWIAYDLGNVTPRFRQRALVAWYAPKSNSFLSVDPQSHEELPLDYTLEVNADENSYVPPADGWRVVARVTGNLKNARHELVELDGARWFRMVVTRSSADARVSFKLDVYGAPSGATDSWLFMGDSITHRALEFLKDDVPESVERLAPARHPAIIEAAIGGTSTVTATDAFAETVEDFPGRYVVLAYGTNDQPSTFRMESLVRDAIADGKVPVVPHMPWCVSEGIRTAAPLINAQIDELYARYPELLPGPDLWAAFEGRADLILDDQVHMNPAGEAHLRSVWAEFIARAVP
jgi:lysophospholipase L1-like esterase